MKKNIVFLSSILLTVFCFSISIFAQETTGNIEGTVKDATGAVVPNVAVTINSFNGVNDASGAQSTGTSRGYQRTINTGNDGFFRLLQIPPGVYVVTTAPTTGFGIARYENVQIVLGKTTQLNIEVAPGQATAVVDVGASDQPVDTTSNEVSSSITAQKIELLPKGTNFLGVLKTAPGVRPDPIAGGFTVDGATNSENVFVIDGQEVTNYRNAGINANNTIPTQLVQEVQVKVSGFAAEYGGATGGVINIVTKGGGNDFRGEFGTQFEPSKIQAGNRPSLLRFTSGTGAAFVQSTEYLRTPKTQFLNSFPTANLSGPIIKDKVWFFGSYSPQSYDSSVAATFFTNAPAATRTITAQDTYRSNTTYQYAFGRIDAQPFSKLRLTSTYLWNPIVQNGSLPYGTVTLGGSDAPVNFGGDIGTLQGSNLRSRQGGRQTSNNVTFQAVYTPLGRLVTTFRYSRGYLNEKLGNYFIPSGTRYVCTTGNIGSTTFAGACDQGFVGPDNTNTQKDISVRTNYEADASIGFKLGGRHDLKGGYQHLGIFNDLNKNFTTRVYLAYGDARINATPFLSSSPATPNPNAIGAGALYRYGEFGSGSNLNQAVYIQDKYQPFRRLTLNLGVRVEKEDIPSFNGISAPFSFGWGDKIAPRLGGSFDLFGDGKTKIFGSYGQFYDRLKFKLAQGSFGGNFYRVDYFDILPNSGSYLNFTPQAILGNFTDPIGGACPTTGFIGSGLSRCQLDYRVASNVPGADIEEAGGIDVNLKPYQQREITVGAEHEFGTKYVVRARYTNKKLINAIEDAGAISAQGSEVYITGNPGQGLHADFLKQFGYEGPYAKPQRKYNALELVLEKRLSNNYYFNANYTLSRLEGNYSGLANTDEQGAGSLNGSARSDPGVNRNFDLPFIGFTAAGKPDNGPLATDRTHVFNAYGAYILNWKGSKTNSSELSFFQTIQSGAPVTSFINFITSTIFTKRGDLGRTPTFTQTDFNVTHRYRFGRDNRFTVVGDLNFLNLFNEENITTYFTTVNAVGVSVNAIPQFVSGGYPGLINAYNRGEVLGQINTFLQGTPTVLNRRDNRYGQPNGYQAGRRVRFGFRFIF